MRLRNSNMKKAAFGVGLVGSAVNAKAMWDVVREISFEQVSGVASLPPKMLVLAASTPEAERIARLLIGSDDLTGVGLGALDTDVWNLAAYDVIFVHESSPAATSKRLRERAKNDEYAAKIFVSSVIPFDRAEADRIRNLMAEGIGDRAMAFARAYPVFRPTVIARLISETAIANAEFSFVANIPSLIPVIGSAMTIGADMIVLTKNQMMMVYKIAASSGRSLDNHNAIITEMIPVVGQGMIWRTVAREATSFLPFAAGTIPKIAISFTGTYALGRAAEYYYRVGKRPSRTMQQDFYRQARGLLVKLPFADRLPAARAIQPGPEDEPLAATGS
jgi:uncharacterized protein (DUF697 family)